MKHKIRIPLLEIEVLVTSDYILKEKEFVGKELEISFYNSFGEQKEKFRDLILSKRKEFYEANKDLTKPFKKVQEMLKTVLNDTVNGDIYSFIVDKRMLPIKVSKKAYDEFKDEVSNEISKTIYEKTGYTFTKKDIEASIEIANDLRMKENV